MVGCFFFLPPCLLSHLCANEGMFLRRGIRTANAIVIFPDRNFSLSLILSDRRFYIKYRHIISASENLRDGAWHTDHTLIIRPIIGI